MKINKEGYKIIGLTGVVCFLLWALMYYLMSRHAEAGLLWFGSILLVLFWFFIVAFFREPRRVKIHDAELVFAPCDGRVVVTEMVHESEYLDREMLQISIFMSITNVHMNWVPVGGEVEYFKYHPGRFLVAWHPKSSTENERTTTVVRMPSGQKVLFRQIAGLIARRIISYMTVGHQVGVLYHRLVYGYLLEGFGMHEVCTHVVLVGELIGTALHTHRLDLRTGGEGILQHAAVFQVFEFGTHESGTFARFHVLKIYDLEGLAVQFDAHADLDVCCSCHRNIFIYDFSRRQSYEKSA